MMTTINLMGLRSREIRAFAWAAKFLSLSFSPIRPSIAIIRENYTTMRRKRYIGTLRSLTTLKPPQVAGSMVWQLSSVARPGCFRRVGRVLLFHHTRFASLLPYDPAFHVVSQLCTTRQPPVSQIHHRRDNDRHISHLFFKSA